MEKIPSIWAGTEHLGYNCFGCAPHNPFGLHMEFYADGEELVCFWEPQPNFQSWVDVLHGGIQCTMLDEVGGWTVSHVLDTCGVTTKMETKYLKPLLFSDGIIQIRGKFVRMEKNIAIMEAQILNGKGILCTQAQICYYTYSQEVAMEKFHYIPKHSRCNLTIHAD